MTKQERLSYMQKRFLKLRKETEAIVPVKVDAVLSTSFIDINDEINTMDTWLEHIRDKHSNNLL